MAAAGGVNGPRAVCPDCTVALPPHDGPVHAYLGGSAACWALFGEVLARGYASRERMKVHRLTVDAYAAQHPGQPGRRTIQSAWVHLAALHLVLDRGVDHAFAGRVVAALAADPAPRDWLVPPADRGTVTVADVARAADDAAHAAAVHHWARSVWAAWRPHHAAVIAVADRVAAKL